MRIAVLSVVLVAAVAVGACHHGRDTGPKKPLDAAPFKPLVERFAKRCRTCMPDIYKVVLKKEMGDAEKAMTAKIDKAVASMRKELLQCLTGQGYGNEPNAQARVVNKWLAEAECAAFAKLAFETQCSSALASTLEEAGFGSDLLKGLIPPDGPKPR